METLRINHAVKFSGSVSVPGDKSISHRAAILAALASGEVTIKGFLRSKDCLATLRAIKNLGVRIEGFGKSDFKVYGVGLRGLKKSEKPLDMENSGTGLRLLSGVLSGCPFTSEITGDNSLQKRPMKRIIEPLTQMGAHIEGVNCPLKITGGRLKGIDYVSNIASAQVKSCVLLAGLLAEGRTSVTEPVKSRNHTEQMLRYLGANINVKNLKVTITGGSILFPKPIIIPGDISSAAFIITAGAIIPGASVKVKNVEINSTRAGYLYILKRMGADISWTQSEIEVRGSNLHGTDIGVSEIPSLIDELPVLAVASAFSTGQSVLRGAQELRVKECDRIKAVVTNLKKFGVDIEEKEDGWIINSGRDIIGAEVSSFGDHRIAMSMVVAGLAAKGETVVQDTSWIETSFPGFMDAINKLRQAN